MITIGVVSPGAMGSALGATYVRGGARVVATVAGRSDRTSGLAAGAGIELVSDLDEVVRDADVILSVVPPAEAVAVVDEIVSAAGRVDSRPLVADLNAIAPSTALRLAGTLASSGLDLVDGSISGRPLLRGGTTTRL